MRRRTKQSLAGCMPRPPAPHSMHERDASFPLKLPPLLVERAVAAALEEDLDLAGDITTDSIVPGRGQSRSCDRGAQSRYRGWARSRRGCVQGARSGGTLHADRRRRRQSRGRRRDRRDCRQNPRAADRRADRAQLPRPLERHRHADRVVRRGGRRHRSAHRLHAQNHAGITRLREIRGADAAAASTTASASTTRCW